jgi:hypothetical protein
VGSSKEACAFAPSTAPGDPVPANVVIVGPPGGIVVLLLLVATLFLLQEASNKAAGKINVKGIFIFSYY